MDVSKFFSLEYSTTREHFLEHAAHTGCSITHHVNKNVKGRYGEELAIDVAVYEPPDADTLLLCNSGIHGVEGITGSACQRYYMNQESESFASNKVKLIFIHALNPYGFSYWRRTNEQNVDLNRNFVDCKNDDLRNDGYAELHSALFPRGWDGRDKLVFERSIGSYISTHGLEHTQAVATKGQYTHEDGLFYGGKSTQWSNRVFTETIKEHINGMKRVAFIDIHTGLGPKGVGELIFNGETGSRAYTAARTVFGDAIRASASGESVANYSNGLVVNAFKTLVDEKNFAAVTIEFGTRSLKTVMDALRKECWHHIHSPEESDAWKEARQISLDAFYINEEIWQCAVLEKFMKVMNRTVDALQLQ